MQKNVYFQPIRRQARTLLCMASLLTLLLIAQSSIAQFYDWRVMNNYLSSYSAYPGDPNTVFAGDMNGLIRRSTDKGDTWKMVASNCESEIKHISFLDNNNAFASTSESSLVMKTTNGGLTWSRVRFKDKTTSTLQSGIKRIVRIDNNTAFFDCYNHPISAPTPKEALVTRDGGVTFDKVFCPGNVYHANGDTLIAFGREIVQFGLSKFTVYKSVDKGLSWAIVKTSPAGLSSALDNDGMELASFKNSQTFYITAYKGDNSMYKTTDGGLSFSVFQTPSNTKFKWWHFKNDNEIIGIEGKNGWSYATTDGGTNWTQLNKSLQVPGIALTDGSILTHSQGRSVISTDFGATATEQSDLMSALTGGSDMFFMQVVNDSVSYAAYGISIGTAVDPALVKTDNKGITWKKVKNNTNTQYYAHTYRFLNTNSFLYTINGVGGNLEIRRSNDGGLTSQLTYTGNWQEKLKEIVSIDGKNLVGYTDITNQPATFYSADSGMTWAKRSMSFSAGTPYNLSFPNKDAWYEVHQGIVSKSIDQGQTWIDITGTLPAGCASQIHFKDAQSGFVYGNCSPNKFFTTTDGGTTWTNISSNNSFTAMAFQDQNTGYASAPLINTTDGGTTWNPYYRAYTGGSVIKIDFDDKATTGAMLSTNYYYSRYMNGEVFVTDTLEYTNQATGIVNTTNDPSTVHVFPNPATSLIYIETNYSGFVSICNMLGQAIIQKTVTSGLNELNIQELPKGVYIINMHSAKAIATKLFVKE